MQKERARARTPIERERARRESAHATRTQGSKAGGSGERADANSEFARKYNLDDKELGTGAFSRVILATSNEGTKVAVKCISKNGELKQEDIDSLHEEVAVLRSVDHPNIVKLYDFFDEKRYYYMAIELMEGGELFERIVKKTFYNEMDARGLVRILLDALAYLHHRGIVHRDLKPENLLLKSPFNDFDIKLADFGFVRTPASFFSHGRGVARVLIRSPCEVSAARAPSTRPATTPRRRPHRRGARRCSRGGFAAEARRRRRILSRRPRRSRASPWIRSAARRATSRPRSSRARSTARPSTCGAAASSCTSCSVVIPHFMMTTTRSCTARSRPRTTPSTPSTGIRSVTTPRTSSRRC